MEELLMKLEASQAEVAVLKERERVLCGTVAELTKKILELEARLNKNSRNSNKPPSSDGPGKGAPKNSRVPSGKPSGGQKGHEGRTKELSSEPDKIVELKPITECECGGDVVETDNFTVRQVTDLRPAEVFTIY